MYGKKQKDVKIQEKGITLIALIITIIVLLILAGVTIASLNGSDSAPAKANEAKQKNDIGAAKDDVAITVQNALTDAYTSAYVDGGSTKESASTDVGTAVKNAVNRKYGTTVQRGLANIKSETKSDGNGEVTIWTTDFKVLGTIDKNGGILTWGEIGPNNGTTGGGSTGNNPADNPNSVYSLAKAGTVQVGQKIGNYVPQDKEITDEDLNLEGASIERRKLASIDGVNVSTSANANQIRDWVVLDVNQSTGEVLIVPDTTSTTNSYVDLNLSGMNGYNNSEKALNLVAGMYTDSKFAESARSITVEDVNKVGNHTPDGNVMNAVFQNDYGMNNNLDIVSSSSEDALSGTIQTESNGEPLTISGNLYRSTAETRYYSYSLGTTFLSYADFWLASRCVYLGSNNCNFNVRYLDGGSVDGFNLFDVYDSGSTYDNNRNYCVLPVVSLKSGINMTWDETNSAWNLSV